MQDHLGLLIAGALSIITVLHVWAAVGFDQQVALAALGVVDRPQILLASVIILASLGLPYAVVQLPRYRRYLYMESGQPLTVRVAAHAVFSLALILAVSTFGIFAFAIVSSVLFVNWWRIRKAKREQRLTDDGRIVVSRESYEFGQAMLATSIGGLLLMLLVQPWTPLEELVVSGRATPISGYVLGTDGQRTLFKSGGDVRWISNDDIRARRMCPKTTGWLFRPIPDFFQHADKPCARSS